MTLRLSRAVLTAAALWALSPVTAALADPPAPTGASPWSKGMHSAVRLVDGGVDAGRRMAGLEIRLDSHFKTYWRTPGDSGLPPVFDWSGSRNVRDVAVRWPAPLRFDDSAGSSIGYAGSVVLPLVVTPADPDQPATLELRLDYAVCEKICIPAKAEARLALPARPLLAPQAGLVRKAEATVPAPGRIGDAGPPAVRAVRVEDGGRAVVASVVVPENAGVVDLFTEGPDGWTFAAPLAVAVTPAPGGLREVLYRVKVDARPPGRTLAGLPVSLTLTADERAVEVSTRLDATGSTP